MLEDAKNILYDAGLENIAKKNGVSIPHAAHIAMVDLLDKGKLRELLSVIQAADRHNPQLLYTAGLWREDGVTDTLRRTTETMIQDLKKTESTEHIEPTIKAFVWHTGQDF